MFAQPGSHTVRVLKLVQVGNLRQNGATHKICTFTTIIYLIRVCIKYVDSAKSWVFLLNVYSPLQNIFVFRVSCISLTVDAITWNCSKIMTTDVNFYFRWSQRIFFILHNCLQSTFLTTKNFIIVSLLSTKQLQTLLCFILSGVVIWYTYRL